MPGTLFYSILSLLFSVLLDTTIRNMVRRFCFLFSIDFFSWYFFFHCNNSCRQFQELSGCPITFSRNKCFKSLLNVVRNINSVSNKLSFLLYFFIFAVNRGSPASLERLDSTVVWVHTHKHACLCEATMKQVGSWVGMS